MLVIKTYEDALAAIGLPVSEIDFPAADLSIKPTNYLKAPVAYSPAENAILASQERIHFE